MRKTIKDCVVLIGPELTPFQCKRFEIDGDKITKIDKLIPVTSLAFACPVIIPALYNSHTHMGDSFLPDGATGMTLEEGFFRPNGYKYRQLKQINPRTHLDYLCDSLNYMARTGTICHIDFREQGVHGSEILREASNITGVDSVILGQFDNLPFSTEQLNDNTDPLSDVFLSEIDAVLNIADGFSESTINDLTDPAWQAIYHKTQAADKLRAIHCLENDGYRTDSIRISGIGDLDRALSVLKPHLVIHMTVATQDEITTLAKSGSSAVLNPRANANLNLPVPPIAQLIDSNANLLLGTDNGLLNSPNMFAELDFTYKITKSQINDAKKLAPNTILKMATSNIQHVLGSDHYGYLDEGLPANFVVLDFSKPHLRLSRHITASTLTRVTPEDVIGTYRLGKAIYSNQLMNSLWS
jgi:cytosine/adenosine deaminase-related metal-dependent hydrolase